MNHKAESVLIKEYTYDLPSDRIAEFPLEERHLSKLLVYENGTIEEDVFLNIPSYLPPQSLVVLNNTQVIKARLLFQKPTGGVIEIFCLEPADTLPTTESMQAKGKSRWYCMIGGASKWKPGQVLKKEVVVNGIKHVLSASYIEKKVDSFVIEFNWPEQLTFAEELHAAGAIPLPPYIKRKAVDKDADSYQTIFAKHQGSVAAPTAALHFSAVVFNELQKKELETTYVTLHVGAGTFKPVKSETIAEHQMHAEQFQVCIDTLEKLIAADKIIAVGTTSLRTLESLYWIGLKILKGNLEDESLLHLNQWEAYELDTLEYSYRESLLAILHFLQQRHAEELVCRTSLIIIPGYRFRSAKALITNFHQPQSTLLLLIAAFIGEDWKKVYEYALQNNFRFLSYGDSSLLWRKD